MSAARDALDALVRAVEEYLDDPGAYDRLESALMRAKAELAHPREPGRPRPGFMSGLDWNDRRPR
jgi:hypothetical protein